MNNTTVTRPSSADPTTPTGRPPHPLQPWREVPWLAVLGLGAFALVRPAIHVAEFVGGFTVASWVPLAVTVVITAVWVAVAGFGRWRRPFTSMLATGLTYAVLTVLLSGIGGVLLMGGAQGPLADPLSMLPITVTNLLWGVVAGVLAMLLQRALGIRVRAWQIPEPSSRTGRVVAAVVVSLAGALVGALAGVVVTDLMVLFGSRDALTADPLRWVIAALVPGLALVGLVLAHPLHRALRQARARRRPSTTS